MTKRKFTIELDEKCVAMIEKVKIDGISMEEAIDGLIHMGLLEVVTQGEQPGEHLLGKLKGFMEREMGGQMLNGMEALLPKAKCGVMRMTPDGEVTEVSREDIPAELLDHVNEIEKAFADGMRAGKTPHDVMKELGLSQSIDEAMTKPSTPVTDGNLVHFPIMGTKPN